jgi:hypothetical protein
MHLKSTIKPKGELSWIHERKEIIRERPWIRPVLVVFSLASIVGGFFIADWAGAVIGLVLTIVGEVYGPKTIHRIIQTPGKAQ